jgi:predicted lipid carrier protein YhbT
MQPDFPFPAFVLPGPLNLILTRLMRGMARRHPAILRRLGDKAGARILIDVTDAPFPLLMEPAALRLTAVRRDVACDAVIRGRLAAFLDMLHGGADGDALFFSGALEISGDTAAVLALRNALDDAELDLTDELAAEGGPLAPILRRGAALLARRSGLMLTRHTGGMR